MAKKRPRGMIINLIREYFMDHPNEPLEHDPVVDWVTEQVVAAGYTAPRDIWRTIRLLHERGMLKQVDTGIFMYDPEYARDNELQDFPTAVKQAIFKRDNYRCVVCGQGRENGVRIAADHKKPKSKGGTNTLENGQTLCYKHNSMKKDYSQTEAGKRYFLEIYNTAVETNDDNMKEFCEAVFDAYDKYDLNGHIERPDRKTT